MSTPSYFTNLTAQINAASSCAELQLVADASAAALNDLMASITAQCETIAPELALLTIPDNPTAVVEWVSTFITSYLTPQLAAYESYVTTLAALVAQVTAITAAIEAASIRIGMCTVTIPTITPGTIPSPPTPPVYPPYDPGLVVADSIIGAGTSASPLQLEGDLLFPGFSMVYGTDAFGAKGWQVSSGGGGGTGTVTDVDISTPGAGVVVGGGPINVSGTLTVDLSAAAYASLALADSALQSAVTSIVAGAGLTGGTITHTGTVALDFTRSNTWTGNTTFNPASGIAGTFIGVSGSYALSMSGVTNGWSLNAGSTSTDITFNVTNAAGTVRYARLWGDGGFVVGPSTTTGGTKGPGTVNVSGGFYVNGVLVTGAVQPQFIESAGWNNNNGSTLTAIIAAGTVAQDIQIPYNCTLQNIRIQTQLPSTGPTTGSCVIDLASSAFPFVTGTDITGGSPPTLSGGTSYDDSTLAGYTTVFTQGTMIRVTLASCSNFASVKIMLRFK